MEKNEIFNGLIKILENFKDLGGSWERHETIKKACSDYLRTTGVEGLFENFELWNEDNSKLLGEIDIWAVYKNYSILMEIKSSTREYLINKGREQTYNQVEYVTKNIAGHNMYALIGVPGSLYMIRDEVEVDW